MSVSVIRKHVPSVHKALVKQNAPVEALELRIDKPLAKALRFIGQRGSLYYEILHCLTQRIQDRKFIDMGALNFTEGDRENVPLADRLYLYREITPSVRIVRDQVDCRPFIWRQRFFNS
ncbi:hypothetical protein [Pseudomonas izuensis]|uniref:hypothetical protein n=1 Tax=Pseudomonas izuensis TaxID=2684212 RepID=UPI00135B6987|nr:hypothetical protein [Pseudomonas izuensis]